MKKLTVLFLLIPVISFSQNLPVNEETGKVTFEKVVEAEGLSKSEIYAKIKEWIAKGAGEDKDRKGMIKLDEKEAGRLIIESRIFINNLKTTSEEGLYAHQGVKGNFFVCNITFLIKDNRYKWEATNFYHHGSRSQDNMRDCGDVENEICGPAATFNKRLTKIWMEIKLKLPGAMIGKMQELEKSVLKDDMNF